MAILKDSCFHCCNVRDGSLVVGVLFLAVHVLDLGIRVISLLSGGYLYAILADIASAVIDVVAIVIDSLMIQGVIKAISKFLYWWVVAAVIIAALGFFVVLFVTFLGGGPQNLIVFWIVYLVKLVLVIYGVFVVYSHYQNLRDGVVDDGPPGIAVGTASSNEMQNTVTDDDDDEDKKKRGNPQKGFFSFLSPNMTGVTSHQ
ncbi:uncharacterized protein LOC118424296 [Branchiostoma floridae]|uniref:Uncharacterized protein LOC118424296 n=1 Tax=Branchiostoma floridae TaxID=7739 RepID=A0A9J7LTA8_BRAFL|nr:uncharacterized protein LOC118424296 [Branchiostoma floridae]